MILCRALIVAVGQHATELWVVPIVETFERCGHPITELEHDEGAGTHPSALRRSAARTVAHTFTPAGSSKDNVELSLHQLPLSPDTWCLWVYTVGDNRNPASDLGSNKSKLTQVLCHCKMDGSTGEIKNISRAPLESLYLRAPNGLSYSGHVQVFDAYGRRWQLIVPLPSPVRHLFGIRHCKNNGDPLKLMRTDFRGNWSAAQFETDHVGKVSKGHVELEDCGDFVSISPYAGARTYCTHRYLNVVYYQ
uniref:Uncharacterized protein n=1 Tax=Mycena chlorophos TaxID=658473 RepID=A0ABQ0LKY3_MYCCL|nr:predicted protein [Mycena chlorophos]